MSRLVGKIRGGIRCLQEHGIRYTTKLFVKKARNKLSNLAKKGLNSINERLIKLGKRIELGFITIIRANIYIRDERYDKAYFFFLFGKQIYPRKKSYVRTAWSNPNQPTMYLKVNRMSLYAKPCVQHWVNIARQMKADYYLVCDNPQLQYHLLRSVSFPGSNIKFITSDRKKLQKISETLSTPKWRNATCAHLTPFYHARQINKQKFWSIDADDTMICLEDRRVAQALMKVQNIADKENINAYSLDMWRSRSFGRYWTWGVAYISNTIDFCTIFQKNDGLKWFLPYSELDHDITFDWFFTYLKDSNKAKIETYYIDNTYFIHWGDFIRYPFGAHIMYWHNKKLTFPILKYIFNYDRLGVIDIADCQKIDIMANEEERLRFFENEVVAAKFLDSRIRALLKIGDFSTMKKSIEKL